jgi:hypothetical protein
MSSATANYWGLFSEECSFFRSTRPEASPRGPFFKGLFLSEGLRVASCGGVEAGSGYVGWQAAAF